MYLCKTKGCVHSRFKSTGRVPNWKRGILGIALNAALISGATPLILRGQSPPPESASNPTSVRVVDSVSATGPGVQLLPSVLNFGTVSTSKRLTTKLTNIGTQTLSITQIIISPKIVSFNQTNNCGSHVSPGGSCTITVSFVPINNITYSANLEVFDNAAGSPQRVLLIGKGNKRQISAQVRSAVSRSLLLHVPTPTGADPVGTHTEELIDSKRNESFLHNGAKRELLMRFWYPASSRHGCKRAEYTSPRVWQYFSELLNTALPDVSTNSCVDAPVLSGAHPVVLLTPGYTGTFTDYTFLAEDLASRGYIVASINHTFEATAVELSGGRLVKSVFGSHLGGKFLKNESALSLAVAMRLSDFPFVLDQLEILNTRYRSLLAGKMDLENIAIIGHSLGGVSALLALQQEKRLKVGVVLDAGLPDGLPVNITKPVFLLGAGRGRWSDADCRLWNGLRSFRFALDLVGAEHLTPSDAVWLANGSVRTGTMGTAKTVTAMRDYVTAFLDFNLGRQPRSDFVERQSSEYPDVRITTRNQMLCR
jgi:pimeloyl-ACP methyl ester carboxylesterase